MKKAPERPTMIYDGDCGFCRKWVGRWQARTGDRVEYVASAAAAERFPEIPREDMDASVQLVEPGGARYGGAEAVFRAMAAGGPAGRMVLRVFLAVPLFRAACEAGYRFVAKRRRIFSLATALLWGRDVRPPTYAVSAWIFLRLVGVVYLIAFASYWVQASGLVGSGGILPAGRFFDAVREALGGEAGWRVPSVLWATGASDAAIGWLCALGCALAVCLIFGFAPPLALAGMWVLYLSLVQAGQVFYAFQWDNLLLEAGFLAIFLAPWQLRPRLRSGDPHPAARLLLWWLLFRVILASGVVKLTSGDPAWGGLTALEFHWFTQPIPNPVAWYLAQMPEAAQVFSCAAMFAVELALPFLIFMPRNLRLLACAGFVGLQVLIELSGNYGFFNLLTAALALLLIDDVVWGRGLRTAVGDRVRSRGIPGVALWPAAAALVAVSLVPLWSAFRSPPPPVFGPLVAAHEWAAPFRTINGYGLFAVMTKERPEILVQGSDDGFEWKTYTFRFKPGPPGRRPPFVAPYMPRLDWQMWFAALGGVNTNPWFAEFLRGLLEARPDVIALLESDPFGGERPRYARALLDDYRFTTPDERRESGDWWRAEPRAIYVPEITLSAFRDTGAGPTH